MLRVFHLGRTSVGNIWRFHRDVPDSVVREINELCLSEPVLNDESPSPPLHSAKYVELIGSSFNVFNVRSGPLYHWVSRESQPASSVRMCRLTPADAWLLKGEFEAMRTELPAWQPFVALIEEGRAVAVCRSSRVTDEAHEAGVETLPEFRGRGYAVEVSSAWAQAVRETGAVPLYSTFWSNRASQNVAKKLRLEFVGSDFAIG